VTIYEGNASGRTTLACGLGHDAWTDIRRLQPHYRSQALQEPTRQNNNGQTSHAPLTIDILVLTGVGEIWGAQACGDATVNLAKYRDHAPKAALSRTPSRET